MSLQSLLPLIKKSGSDLNPKDFQHIINVIFHDHEAVVYDQMHQDMQNSLQQQMDLLVGDLKSRTSFTASNLSLLDIGCGTAMSTETILKTSLGPQIESITLLDSSPKMLELANEKSHNWNKKVTVANGYLDVVSACFDIVLICSVLHHIPDLSAFITQLKQKINPGGVIIHLQDPAAEAVNDFDFLKRQVVYNELQKKSKKPVRLANFIPKKLKHFINLKLGRKNYIDNINDDLLSLKAIKNRLTADEIWSVTDIHVPSKNDISQKGISFAFLEKQLQGFENVSRRTYGFFGVLKSDLPENLAETEEILIQENALNGRNLGCVWVRK